MSTGKLGSTVASRRSPAPTVIGVPGSHGLSEPPPFQVYEPSWPGTGSPPSTESDTVGGLPAAADGVATPGDGSAVEGDTVGVAAGSVGRGDETVGDTATADPLGPTDEQPAARSAPARIASMARVAAGRRVGCLPFPVTGMAHRSRGWPGSTRCTC